VERSKLAWHEEQPGDVVDLARLKDYLLALRRSSEHDPEVTQLPGVKKQEFEQRLFLLEHEIDGLLKRKINFTSTDNEQGTRFLDYTVMLNDKEN
jgi:hypothetical protein